MTMGYTFDDFVLNPATRELRRAGVAVALPARAFDCLAYLIAHRERAVGRDELISAVWGRAEVSEALLNHTVVKIRRALDDTGSRQRTIRTVPRFGYHWVGEVAATQTDADAVDAADVAPAEAPATMPDAPSDSVVEQRTAAPSPPQRRWHLMVASAAAVIALAIAAVVIVQERDIATNGAASSDTTATDAPLAAPALVLPAEIAAPDDWRWLRFGLMDLVANRLRSGAVHTVPSESVVSLLKQRAASSGDALLHDADLGQFAAMRILPRATLASGRWTVRLEAFGAQRTLSAEAQGDDAIAAASEATDELLRKLGRVPNVVPAENTSPALDELLQRSGAAMLADQLDQARGLIAAAPLPLQQTPQIEQRMAQIELRSGDYEAVETRLRALLDRLPRGHDDALRARAMITLAASHLRRHEVDKAAELYDEAIALRADRNDPEVMGVARLGRGIVFAQGARYDEASAELSRARSDLAAVGDGLGVAGVDVNLGDFQLLRHRPADALPIFRNAVREFERLGAREGRAYALSQQSAAERELLDIDAAVATSERFWPPEQNTSNLRMRSTLALERAAVLTDSGRHDAAELILDGLRAGADVKKDALLIAQVDAAAADLAAQRGDAAATARLAAAAMTPQLADADGSVYVRAALVRARALRSLGQSAAATAVVTGLGERAKKSPTDAWLGAYATLAAAEDALASHQREAALEKFAAAMKVAEALAVPEDLVAIGAPTIAALIAASQLDTAQQVSGRIAMWADRDLRAASAEASLFHALGRDDAARRADEVVARLTAGRNATSAAKP